MYRFTNYLFAVKIKIGKKKTTDIKEAHIKTKLASLQRSVKLKKLVQNGAFSFGIYKF